MMWSDDGIVLRLPEAADELPLDELLIDPDEIDELVVVDAAAARRCSPPGSASARPGRCCCPGAGPTSARRCGSSASGPPTCWRWRRSTRRSRSCSRPPASACTTCSTCPRCARCSADLRSRDDPARHRRHAEGVAVRPVPAVRLDRRLHVRGRRAAGRAPGRGAGARPRPAARPARRRGAARAARPRRARRPRARAAAPRRRPPGARSPTSCTTCCARLGDLSLDRGSTCGRRRAPARPAWIDAARAPSGGPSRVRIGGEERVRRRRGRGPLPRRARRARSRSACRRRSPSRSTRPLEELVGALRPHPRPVPRRRGRPPASASPPERVVGALRRARGRRAASCAASSGPTASSASGATSTCCASCAGGRSPRCAARSSRSSRTALARFLPAWQGIGRRSGAASTPWSRRSACCRARPIAGLGRSRPTCCPPGCAATGRPTSTRCAPPARSCGSAPARSAPTDGRVRLFFRDQLALLAPALDARPTRPDGPLHDALREHLAARGACVLAPTSRGGRGRRRDRRRELLAALWDLVWAGEVTNDSLAPLRAFARRRRAAPAQRRRRRGAPRGRPRPGRLDRIGPPAGAGPLVARRAAAASRRPRRPRRPTPGACSCSSATACSPARRRWPRASRAGSPACTPCSRRSRSGARSAAATSSPGSARPSSPCPARSTACGRSRGRDGDDPRPTTPPIVLAATDPAQPYGAALPWPEPPGGRPGRGWPARSSCWGRRACSPGSTGGATTSSRSRRRRATTRWADAPRRLVKDGRVRSLEVRKIDGEPGRQSPSPRRCGAVGFVDGYRGLVLRG